MMGTIIAWVFVFVFFCYIAWRKYKEHHGENKKGRNTNERKKSIEELRQHESRFRGPGGGKGM